MRKITFCGLSEHLKHGREIEFFYKGKRCSITNHSGFWHLCDDTEHVILDTVCRFEERDILIAQIVEAVLDGMTIAQIFNEQLYDADGLAVLQCGLKHQESQ